MSYKIRIHPRVKKYLDTCSDKSKIIEHLKSLSKDPFNSRAGVDIKKLKGKKHELFRIRVGQYRFEYFVEEKIFGQMKLFLEEEGIDKCKPKRKTLWDTLSLVFIIIQVR